MDLFGINGSEFLLLLILAVVILGPERLPEYAAKFAHGIRKARVMAEGAKGQLKEQLGPEYAEINWRQYDPRQYDPRRIVREALAEPLHDLTKPFTDAAHDVAGFATDVNAATAAVGVSGAAAAPGVAVALSSPPARAFTPFDSDAT